jgi:hypothetical protein
MTKRGEFVPGDRVRFIEDRYKLTGTYGVCEGRTPYTALVQFDNGSISTWPANFFVRVPEGVGPSIPPEAKQTGSMKKVEAMIPPPPETLPRIPDSERPASPSQRRFTCGSCGGILTFRGRYCPHCGRPLG